jgi:hypothetical protein
MISDLSSNLLPRAVKNKISLIGLLILIRPDFAFCGGVHTIKVLNFI